MVFLESLFSVNDYIDYCIDDGVGGGLKVHLIILILWAEGLSRPQSCTDPQTSRQADAPVSVRQASSARRRVILGQQRSLGEPPRPERRRRRHCGVFIAK